MSGNQTASLSLWRDRFIFTSPHFIGEQSCRPSTVVIIGVNDDIQLESSGRTLTGRAFLVGANVSRKLTSGSSGLYSLNIDPISPYSRELRGLVKDGGILDLTSSLNEHILLAARESVEQAQTCAEIRHHSQRILNELFPEIVGIQPLDIRVDIVSSWLWTHVPAAVDLQKLSALCGLSESRLAHLFTQEVGISIRQYLLWVKMRYAAELFVRNRPLSQIAHDIGFSDSSHLSRTFTRYFALTPSYLANNKLVRLQLCDTSPSL